jgi:hypothetical protein
MKKPTVARPKLDDDVIRAFKALSEGVASDHQQGLVCFALLHDIACVDQDCFMSDARTTDFALGRRWVGLVLREMFLLPADALGLDKNEAEKVRS